MNKLATAPQQSSKEQAQVLVIGGGPVGLKFTSEYTQVNPNANIIVFNNEAYPPYNRARLSLLLAGKISRDSIDLDADLPAGSALVNVAIATVDCDNKTVTDVLGEEYHFDKLVFATGARAFVPTIPGTDLSGVFPFRSLQNTEALLARTIKAREVLVVGGGILGVETAVAMSRFNTKVTLVHQSTHLLNRQLDASSAKRLQTKLNELGISVKLGSGVGAILGQQSCQSVQLRSGEELPCDTVVLCCGSSPNIELARSAGVRVNRGIVVDDYLETSISDIYAIGECCEHGEQNYGLVSPGYEQASILASRLGGDDVVYTGSNPESLLKVLDFPLRSFGDPVNYRRTPFDKELSYQTDSQYLKLVTSRGKLVGGMLLGDADESAAIIDLYQRQKSIPWYRRLAFNVTGRLWPLADQNQPQHWQSERIICRCQQVNVGQINNAVQLGASSIKCLGRELRAGVTCGTCQPQLSQLLEVQTGRKQILQGEPLWRASLGLAVLAVIAIFSISMVPGLSVGSSIDSPALLEQFWNDKYWKQVSGFTLLAVTTLGLVVSLRKRLPWFRFGEYSIFRFLHTALGASCLAVLGLHTGLHLGTNLNRWLVVNYLILLSLGALTAASIALSHKLSGRKSQLLRKSWSWLHILATWPLPALLAIHIASVYRF